MDRATARRRTNEERCAELDARSAGAQAEVRQHESQLRAWKQELEANRVDSGIGQRRCGRRPAGAAAAPAGGCGRRGQR